MSDDTAWLGKPMHPGRRITRGQYVKWLFEACALPRVEGDRLLVLESHDSLREGIRMLVMMIRETKR